MGAIEDIDQKSLVVQLEAEMGAIEGIDGKSCVV